MFIRKRITALLLTTLITVAMFGGCTGGEEQSAGSAAPPAGQSVGGASAATEPVVIEWYTPNWNEAISNDFKAEFESANPDVKVNLVITEWTTYKAKVTAALTANNSPELLTILLTDVSSFAKMGLLEPLKPLASDAGVDFDDIVKSALDIVSVDGIPYSVPFRYDGSGIYYNVDMLAEVGYDSFPETWDETLKLCEALKQKGITATAWYLGEQHNAGVAFIMQLYTNGGDVLNDEETQCLLNTPAAKKALSTIVDTINAGYASSSSLEMNNSQTRDAFGAGQIAFVFSGPYDIETLQTEYPDLNFAVSVIPGVNGMGCSTANGWSLAMSSNCANKEAAARFMAYAMTPKNQARITDSFPGSRTALAYEQFATDLLSPFAKQLENSREEPSFARWAEIAPILYDYIQYAVSGSMTVNDACEGMTADINALLAS